jgi:glycosyltransferase involved in cell wall biosynthesis
MIPKPRVGVITYRPIQYHAPLYQRLAERNKIELDVLFLSDAGSTSILDEGFGIHVTWDIDILSGYKHRFLSTVGRPTRWTEQISTLFKWIPSHDAVIVHGYDDPRMMMAVAASRFLKIPYLLRGASHPRSSARGMRRFLRHAVARAAVSGSACGLPVGILSEEFFRHYGARNIVCAPNSIDDERFARQPSLSRSELLARWKLDERRPVILFSGKLIPRKRPLDLVVAANRLSQEVTTIFVGDGSLAHEVRAALKPGDGVVTGFINQSTLPSYYHAADILVLPSEVEVWGLVVNEAMAAGVVPVVSDSVGSAPDLVCGVGEIYPCGDINSLADALERALNQIKDPSTRVQIQRHVARNSLQRTVDAYEEAVFSVGTRDKEPN